MKDFLNYDDVFETFLNLCKDKLKSFGIDYGKYENVSEEYAHDSAIETLSDMKKYVHKKDTRMIGNFCNIREDWEYCHEFIGSEIQPWGKFDDVIKSIDDETISDEDLKKFQTWALDWYFRAFGTFGFTYNFGDYISELEYEEEMEKENAA